MAEIVNLRQVRRRKARAAKEAKAEANRTRFGQTKAEKTLAGRRAGFEEAFLDAHRRERPDEP